MKEKLEMMKINLKTWRYIDSGICSAERNMAIDEALLLNFKEFDMPIFRLYEWDKALSFGRFSNIKQSIDIDLLHKRGIQCVRRFSGGGTLVHDHDLSYSLILPRTFAKTKGVKESYHFLCKFLIRLYEKLGLNANFASDLDINKKSSNICLAGFEDYDIIIENMKIGGNAQRHIKDAFIQHGSIPISYDISLFESLFLEYSGLSHAASLSKFNIDIDLNSLKKIVLETFCESFDATVIHDDLSPQEDDDATRLLVQKYSNDEWTFHKNTKLS
ncbi:MAG: lipoate--protein ligase family protein [Sulfurospirillaceae bacterium]|nr:lipoate--protein ligase family protein [Sulfurospirillaceae bacterium]